MEDLPDELLSLIARQVLAKEEGMKLWCKLASTCTRLWSFQLPAEHAYFLDISLKDLGLAWTLGRLQEACKLNLSLSWRSNELSYLDSSVGKASLQAYEGLRSLKTLELQSHGTAEFVIHCQSWVQKLLLGATNLTALSISTSTLPRAPVIQHLHLRHLELDVLSIMYTTMLIEQLESYLMDIICCPTLESLTIVDIDIAVAIQHGSKVLPSMHLQSMPNLKHVRLVDSLQLQALTLPADCALFVDGCCDDGFPWHAQCQKYQGYTSVLRLSTNDTEWPTGIQGFSNLRYFELRMEDRFCADLADLQHIPHMRVVSQDEDIFYSCNKAVLHLTSGSWQSLEVFFFGELDLTIRNVDSFVRDTANFTFSLDNTCKAADPPPLFKEILRACQRRKKACHVNAHKAILGRKKVTYVTLSTSKEVAQSFPIIYDDNHEEGPAIGLLGEETLCHCDTFWPCDPCASVKQRLLAKGQLCAV